MCSSHSRIRLRSILLYKERPHGVSVCKIEVHTVAKDAVQQDIPVAARLQRTTSCRENVPYLPCQYAVSQNAASDNG